MNGINSIRALTPSEEELVSAGVDVNNVRWRPNRREHSNPTYFVPNRASLRRSNKRIKYGLWGRINRTR